MYVRSCAHVYNCICVHLDFSSIPLPIVAACLSLLGSV